MDPLLVETSYEKERGNAVEVIEVQPAKRSVNTWKRLSRKCAIARSNTAATVSNAKSRAVTRLQELPPVAWFETHFPGWQAGVLIAVVIAIFVLLINLIFLIVAATHHWGSDGLGTLIEGDCSTIDIWNKVAHAFINIMSTFLLMQSNYCMQLLASPTRADVDEAHAKRQWVDIGLQSFKNVWKRHISPWRTLLWLVLAISSVPLHLLWNSVIIFSPSAFTYNQITVTEEFVRGLPFYYNGYIGLDNPTGALTQYPDSLYILQQDLASYKNLTTLQCKRAYAQSFIRDRSDVVVVTVSSSSSSNSSQVLGASTGGFGAWPYQWLCPSDSSQNFKCYNQIRQPTDTWKFPKYNNPEVKYCLSKEIEPKCKLQYGFWIALFVVISNVFKVICFLATLRIMKRDTQNSKKALGAKARNEARLLITTGDALASFLEFPDEDTFGMSIVEKEDFQNGIWSLRWVSIEAMLWRERGECSWFRGVGLRQWLIGLLPIAALAIAPTMFLLVKMDWLTSVIGLSLSVIQQLGIGNPSGLFLLGARSTNDQYLGWRLLSKVALGNSPQLVISVAAYLWNNQLTAMIAAREYDKYAAPPRDDKGEAKSSSKHGLRITNPQNNTEQRSTRFLSIPFRYWITNVVLWTMLHYLASQSLFFARVDILDHWLEVTDWSISQVGYSVLGLIYFIICAFIVLTYVMWISLRRLPNRMPLAATCSGALSAACHPLGRGIKHHEMKVHWGVEVRQDGKGKDLNEFDDEVLQCTFTSGDAYYPEHGRYYA